MRNKAIALVFAALLAFGASGVVTASMAPPAADTASADAPPDNYTVDIVNPDEVSDEDVTQAVSIAWANDEVRSYFDDGAAVHFEVWASELHDGIVHVDVAPMDAPDNTRVIADVDLDEQTVTSIDEPVAFNTTTAMSINASDGDSVSIDGAEYEQNRDDANDEESATRITADESFQLNFSDSTIEPQDDGTYRVDLTDDE